MRILLGWSIGLVLLVGLVACGEPFDPVRSARAEETPTRGPTQTATPVPVCSTKDGRKVIDAVGDYLEEWDDADRLANSTSRIALSPQVAALQSIRRKVQAQEYPPCGEQAKLSLLRLMNAAIDGYISFMQQDADVIVQGHLKREQSAREDFRSALLALQGMATPTPLPLPTATRPPAYGVPTTIFATATTDPFPSPSPSPVPPTFTPPAKLNPTATPKPPGVFGP